MSTSATEIAPGSPYLRRERVHPGWVLLAGLAVAQLFAFWLLCSHQVRKAEARRNESVVQQMALSDCLQYIPGSTIASCHARGGDGRQPAAQSAHASSLSATVPVSFSFR